MLLQRNGLLGNRSRRLLVVWWEFAGPNTTCADIPWCVEYYGSCCFGQSCEYPVSESNCEGSGGIFGLTPASSWMMLKSVWRTLVLAALANRNASPMSLSTNATTWAVRTTVMTPQTAATIVLNWARVVLALTASS